MVLTPSKNCRIYLFERDYCRGPREWIICGIVWNRRDLIEQRELTPGELMYLDERAIRWRL